MSKRLSKRQQRELDELEFLKAQEKSLEAGSSRVSEEEDEVGEVEEDLAAPSAAPVNLFEALGGDEQPDDDNDSDDAEPAATEVKKSAKKKSKKKKKKSTVATPADQGDGAEATATPSGKSKKKKGKQEVDDGMDEVDRALAELNMSRGEGEATTSAEAGPSDIRKMMTFRNLLSVDPKNLDADAELRRFFGSKVIASGQSNSRNHRGGPSAKLRYTISKPKPTYPPATSLAGLTMRELSDEEVSEMYDGRGWLKEDKGEKWFTFEHAGAWREVERQFMGAVRSHDPNELMALLQVYPWHVDTLLQLSEVYRLQSDIGAASDFAERALYAFDRCLTPAFNVSSGACRLDFDRVENRAMFTALHRIISYLGRRGCWSTAFNFAKLLFSLDPIGDPHGASFWLDFLAVKSGNGEWLIQMLEQASVSPAAAAWHAYPGMAYAQALALRADEDAKKHGDHSESDAALSDAIKRFPQVIIPLADKIGAVLPDSARSHPLLEVQASYSDSPSNVMHLLSHIYVARSEALWKEPAMLTWFEQSVKSTISHLDSKEASESRSDALALIQSPRDMIDTSLNVPLFICRHVFCSESTSWLGFLPPPIKNKPFNSFDPLPPSSAVSAYDAEYFNDVRASGNRRRGGRGFGGLPAGMDGDGRIGQMMQRLMGAVAGGQEGLGDRLRGILGDVGGVGEEEIQRLQDQLLEVAAMMPAQGEDGGMPGAFPGQTEEER